jgi:hypothetical protein
MNRVDARLADQEYRSHHHAVLQLLEPISPDVPISPDTNLLAAWQNTRLVGAIPNLIGRQRPLEPSIVQLCSAQTDLRRDTTGAKATISLKRKAVKTVS